MTEAKVWAISEDGNIEYVSLTRDRLDEVVTLLQTYFFPYENLGKATGFAYRHDAIAELEDLLIHIAMDGVSIVAVDKKTGKVAGALLNHIEDKNENTRQRANIDETDYPEVKSMRKVIDILEDSCDPFTLCNVDCVMELLFLVVSPEYSKRGIALKLSEVSIELATLLYKGKNVKTSLNDDQLPLEARPQIVTSLFTNFKTQKIGRKLNFDILQTFSYEDLYHDGKSFASILGSETKGCTTEYKRLE